MSAQQCLDFTVLKCALCSFSRDEMSVSDCWQRRLKFFVLFRWPIRVQVLVTYRTHMGR